MTPDVIQIDPGRIFGYFLLALGLAAVLVVAWAILSLGAIGSWRTSRTQPEEKRPHERSLWPGKEPWETPTIRRMEPDRAAATKRVELMQDIQRKQEERRAAELADWESGVV